MNELIDKFLFELFDGLRDKTTVLFGEFIADAHFSIVERLGGY